MSRYAPCRFVGIDLHRKRSALVRMNADRGRLETSGAIGGRHPRPPSAPASLRGPPTDHETSRAPILASTAYS